MSRPSSRPQRASGYTLVEVLIVVTIIGFASAIIVPNILAAGTMGVQAAARIIVADILYAQNEAIARQRPVSVVFEPANDRYTLVDDVAGTTRDAVDLRLPALVDARDQESPIVEREFQQKNGMPCTGKDIC